MEAYQQLEVEIGEWINSTPERVVACSSGTSALHLALEALKLRVPGEVILPDMSMVACARAVVMAGLTPVFVDCDEHLLMKPALVRQALSENTRAVMIVHIYGRRVEVGDVRLHLRSAGSEIRLIEDMAELHGVKPYSKTDAACWSFYRNKVVGGEEGGCVSFLDPEHAKLARSLRSLGFTEDHDFKHVPRGHNYRMSNVHAGLISESLSRVDFNLGKRRLSEAALDAMMPDSVRMPPRQSPWVYDLRIVGMDSRRQWKLINILRGFGIAARHCFKPMSSQDEFHQCRVIGNETAHKLSSEIIYLPLPLERGQIEKASGVVKRFIEWD